MRIARIAHPKDGLAFASLEGSGADEIAREIAEHPFGTPVFTGRTWSLAECRLLAPTLPSKVVCVGKNYADHAKEMGGEAPVDPVIFIKPSTTVIGHNDPIRLPPESTRVDFEGELAVVMNPTPRGVTAKNASRAILGYTIANDVTARDQQQHDGQWTRAKSHDTFCPLGPWIETELDPADLDITTTLDGETKQDSSTAFLLHGIPELIEWISKVMTLLPGDVILTGTPAGVGPMQAGQSVSVSVSGIGTLTNPVVAR
ncbi:fumarylacetoacetate hydrolase family protein [Actinokineospora bangkokensis]|uniref:2-hydroxyhepta-2,4-diene-1,7-dioate isomerase n=1 Tax=Actinokineospora bangkokensis TaxID=1193682 RepID=A0A1Q9LHT0_9PSEU|nr:fumarylacetoacetate hydrolase family protein [Actinokineospora bangkokensis]OLR91602.1 2-hydroxyhepta-2,4-diene-1,7-dioate isomerase [Actinokineospora bangkokensis]